jgi:ligand-binding sensor domain-containing protein/two-component sensor histidine kinase
LLYKPFLLFLFLNAGLVVNAQHFAIQQYTPLDGLPDGFTIAVKKSAVGYLWIGTGNGLSRYDGKQFSNYGYESGLSSLTINQIFEDSQRRLWLSTRKGIVEFSSFHAINFPFSDHLNIGYIFSFVEIDQKVYACTDQGAYEFQDSLWKKISLIPGKENNACRQIIQLNNGWYISYGNEIYFKPKHGKIVKVASSNIWPFYISMIEKSGRIYVNSSQDIWVIKGTKIEKLLIPGVSGKDQYIFYVDSHEKIWISSVSEGLLYCDPVSKKFIRNFIIPSALVSGFAEDDQDNLWAAGSDGLLNISSSSISEHQLKLGAFGNYLLPSSTNDPVIVTANGSLINSKDSSVFEIKLNGKRWTQLVDRYDIDAKGNTWAVTRERELCLFDFSSRRINHLFQNLDGKILTVAYDRFNNVMNVGTDEKIYKFNNNAELIDSMPIKNVYDFQFLDKGKFLINKNGLLCLIEYDNGKTLCTQYDLAPHPNVQLFIDSQKRLWISHKASGVQAYTFEGKKLRLFAKFSTANGLFNNRIFKISEDEQNRIWIFGLGGINILSIRNRFADNSIPVFRITRPGLYTLSRTASILKQGNVFFILNNNNFYTVDAAKLKGSYLPPKIIIEELYVNNKQASVHERGSIFLSPSNLSYDKNSIQVDYQAITLRNDKNIIYSYRLLGSGDSSWSNSTSSTTVSFFKLTPGKYVFEVRCKKSETFWSDSARIAFSITPPFWNTLLFKLLILFNLVLLIFFIVQIRIRRVRKNAFIKTNLTELEMKALRAQMNPHFIYNALNSIQSLIASGKQKDAMRYVSKFGKLLRLILEHSDEGKTSLKREIDVNSLYIELEQLRLGFDFSVQFDIADDIITEEEKVPALIIQPIIENALWHGLTNMQGDKQLTIDVTATEVYLIITITDNGIGYASTTLKSNDPSTTKRKSFGSQLVRKRLTTYNNDNREPLKIIDLKEQGRQGTEVKLYIRRYN